MGKRKRKKNKYYEIDSLVSDMIKELESHRDGEKTWKNASEFSLLNGINKHAHLLYIVYSTPEDIRKHCAHIANYAMMIHDLNKE